MKKKNNWSDLELFTKVNSKGQRLFIYIAHKRVLNFSSVFVREIKSIIDENKYVILNYSKINNAIVLNFTNDANQSGAFKITKHTTHFSFMARSFFNFYKISEKYFGRFPVILEEIPNMGKQWVIYLDRKDQANDK